jgi:hypothetical protein
LRGGREAERGGSGNGGLEADACPSPTLELGSSLIDVGLFLVVELIDDGGEFIGENVPPPRRIALSGGVA